MDFFRALLLLSVISHAASLEICGTQFTDRFSSCMRADLVVVGEFIDSTREYKNPPTYYAQFAISSVLKPISNLDQTKSILIGKFTFGDSQPHECAFGHLQVNLKYIFFLKVMPDDVFEISALPMQWNLKAEKEMKDFICSKNDTIEAPVVRAIESVKNGHFRSNITIECQSSGFPAPLFSWFYREKLVLTRKHHRIVNDKYSSRLTLVNATHNLHGLYTCQAYNIIGSSNATVRINVQLHNVTIQSDHTIKCPAHLDNGFCYHNATCLILVYTGVKTCKCREGYVGGRCEKYFDYDETKYKTSSGSFFSKDAQLLLTIMVPVIVSMLLMALIIWIVVLIKNNYQQRKYMKASREQEFS